MNIYQKLIEVRKSVPYLQKDQNGYKFQYVSSSQTLGALKAKMDELNLLLIPRVLRIRVSDHQTKQGNHEYFTEAWVHFTWVNAEDPKEQIKCPWYGQGLDSGEKGVGKAMTYAEKYFLLKFFNIATDKDDPDSFQDKKKQNPEKESPKTTDKQISNAQLKKLNTFITKNHLDRIQVKLMLKVDSLKNLTRERAHIIFDNEEKFLAQFTKWYENRQG